MLLSKRLNAGTNFFKLGLNWTQNLSYHNEAQFKKSGPRFKIPGVKLSLIDWVACVGESCGLQGHPSRMSGPCDASRYDSIRVYSRLLIQTDTTTASNSGLYFLLVIPPNPFGTVSKRFDWLVKSF